MDQPNCSQIASKLRQSHNLKVVCKRRLKSAAGGRTERRRRGKAGHQLYRRDGFHYLFPSINGLMQVVEAGLAVAFA